MRFGYSIREFIQGEWIVVIFIVVRFKFELLVFCLATERLEFITVVFRWRIVWESLGYSICDVREVWDLGLFTFKCRIGLEEGFPAIFRTIVQTFFIEVRLLILDTKGQTTWNWQAALWDIPVVNPITLLSCVTRSAPGKNFEKTYVRLSSFANDPDMLIINKLLYNNIYLYLMTFIFNETTQWFCEQPWCTSYVNYCHVYLLYICVQQLLIN